MVRLVRIGPAADELALRLCLRRPLRMPPELARRHGGEVPRDLGERRVAGMATAYEVTADHGARAPHTAPAVHEHGVPRVERGTDRVEDRPHVGGRRRPHVADRKPHVGHVAPRGGSFLGEELLVGLELTLLGEVDNVGDAGREEAAELLARLGRVGRAGVLAGEEAGAREAVAVGEGERYRLAGLGVVTSYGFSPSITARPPRCP
jgi:hypothetical protein